MTVKLLTFDTIASSPFSTYRPLFQDKTLTFDDVSSQKTLSNVHAPQSSSSAPSHRSSEFIHKYILYCNFTKNNTHFTLSAVVEDLDFEKKNPQLSFNEKVLYYHRLPQKVKVAISTGQLGFRKSARGEYEAGFQTAAKMFSIMEERNFLDKDLEIIMKNFGKGRGAFEDALKGKEGNRVRGKVVRLSDNTKLKFGGTKSPRVRRL